MSSTQQLSPGRSMLIDDKPTSSTIKESRCFVLRVVIVASLGSFLFGNAMAGLNTALAAINSEYLQCGQADPAFQPYWGLSPGQCASIAECAEFCAVRDDPQDRTLITKVRCPGGYNDITCASLKWYNAATTCSVLIGGTVGAGVAGHMLSEGRRFVLILTLIVFMFGIISSTCASSFPSLLWARLVMGVGSGLASVACPVYISEMAPASQRGMYGCFHQLNCVFAEFVAMFLGPPLLNPSDQDDLWVPSSFQKFWWRFMLAWPIVIVLLALYFFLVVYKFETPMYYVEKRKLQGAEQLLKLIYNKSDINEELDAAIVSVNQSQQSKKKGMTFGKAFKNVEYRKVILVGLALAAFQQLVGINVFMTSSADLFRKTGLTGTMPMWMSVVMTGLLFLGTIPSMFLIEKLGRRTLLFFGSVFQFFFVAPSAVSYWTESEPDYPSNITQYLALLAVFGFIVAFSLTLGPAVWVYLFEVFPLDIKDSAASVALCANWIAGIIMVFATVILSNRVSFTIFAVLNLLCALFVFFFIKETKGFSLGDSPYIFKDKQSEEELGKEKDVV